MSGLEIHEISPGRHAVVMDRAAAQRYGVVVCAGRQDELDRLSVSGWSSCSLVMVPGEIDDDVRAALVRLGWAYERGGAPRCPVHA